MNENEKSMTAPAQNVFPGTVKIGRSEYVIERHFSDNRTITNAIYELLRVEDTLKDSDIEENSS